jgi:DNA-directed RNA polymerase specialized sigma24 family protein
VDLELDNEASVAGRGAQQPEETTMPRVARPGREPLEQDAEQAARVEAPGRGGDPAVLDPVPSEVLRQVETELAPPGDAGTAAETEPDQAARLAIDRRIMQIVAAEGEDGPGHRRLAGRLLEYGYPVLLRWITTGEIFTRCQPWRPVVRRHDEYYSWLPEDWHQLAVETLEEGLKLFFDQAVRQERWDARRGASLQTYYVGACLLSFKKVYNRWWRERILLEGMFRFDRADDAHPLTEVADSRVMDPCDYVVLHDEVTRRLADMTDPQLRGVMGRVAIGYPQREAAEEVGLTPKAVERRLARFRRRRVRSDASPGEQNTDYEGRGSPR